MSHLAQTYTFLGIVLAVLGVLTIVIRGLVRMFRFIRRGNDLFDRLQEMLDVWEGRGSDGRRDPRASIPYRLTELETWRTSTIHVPQARRRPT